MKLTDDLNISSPSTTYNNLRASYGVFNTLNEKQKTVVYALTGQILEENGYDNLRKRRGALENLKIKKVIFNEPATIIFWSDGSKTVVKCGENDFYDHEKGLAMCIVKRYLGNKGNYYNKLRKWLDMYEEGENNE